MHRISHSLEKRRGTGRDLSPRFLPCVRPPDWQAEERAHSRLLAKPLQNFGARGMTHRRGARSDTSSLYSYKRALVYLHLSSTIIMSLSLSQHHRRIICWHHQNLIVFLEVIIWRFSGGKFHVEEDKMQGEVAEAHFSRDRLIQA